MKKSVLLGIFMLLNTSLFAQTSVYEHIGIAYARNTDTSIPSITYHQTISFGKNQAFRFGLGLRTMAFFGKNKTFKNNDVSMLIYQKNQVTTFNIPVTFEIHKQNFLVGLNIDLFGLAFGSKKDSISVVGDKLDSLTAKPVGVNFILGRKGTLNSEFYIGYLPHPTFTVRVGVSIMSSQYTPIYYNSIKKEYLTLDRVRYQSTLIPFISLVFNLEK